MASDISNIIKEELANTLEQLLSKKASVEDVKEANFDDLESSQCVEVLAKFDFSNISSTWKIIVPNQSATKFEYLMLGGMGDLKEHIDDEITDAINEIVSNICGSICTSVNAQGFADVHGLKSEIQSSRIIECKSCSSSANLYEFALLLGGEKFQVFVSFDDVILSYISEISGESGIDDMGMVPINEASSFDSPSGSAPANTNVSALLSDESSKNLKLLFDIKLKLSVRLGTKMFLLKDILRWDIGEIIELEQMVNEPLEILINGIKIGEGEAVIVEGKFGLKIKNIGSESSRLNQIGLG